MSGFRLAKTNVDSKLCSKPLDQLVEAEGVEGAWEGVTGKYFMLYHLVSFVWNIIPQFPEYFFVKYLYYDLNLTNQFILRLCILRFFLSRNICSCIKSRTTAICALPSHSPAGELYSFVIFAPALQEYFHDGNEWSEEGELCGKKEKRIKILENL